MIDVVSSYKKNLLWLIGDDKTCNHTKGILYIYVSYIPINSTTLLREYKNVGWVESNDTVTLHIDGKNIVPCHYRKLQIYGPLDPELMLPLL